MTGSGWEGLHAEYQPVVHLDTGELVAFEALARGTEPPTAMLAQARREGRSAELDWLCRCAALSGALDGELGSSLTLFVNVEPDTPARVPPHCLELVERAGQSLRIVLELTERAVVHRPAELLALVDWARQRSWGIALDDIGEDPASLAMMPFLEPDIIKLDLRLVQQRPSAEIGLIMSAVLAQAERTGAVVVAEGVEDEASREAALALGATYGQGWMYGAAAPLPVQLPVVSAVVPLRRSWTTHEDATPFSLVRSALPVRRGSKSQLLSIATHLETRRWRGPTARCCCRRSRTVSSSTTVRASATSGWRVRARSSRCCVRGR